MKTLMELGTGRDEQHEKLNKELKYIKKESVIDPGTKRS